MSPAVSYKTSIAVAFIWSGAVFAISFLEAWLKFRAPGVTLPIGLGIGRIVFAALNKIEWLFCIAIIACLIFQGTLTLTANTLILIIIASLLLLQTFWLLPQLDARAELHISGQDTAPSSLHLLFIIAEALKIILLVSFGLAQFEKFKI
ncbi:MAG: hypothetical protein R2800_03605 [Flavipsychrobacter sp.]